MSVADRAMAGALRGLGRLGGSELIDRLGLRDRVEATVFQATKQGFRAAGASGRAFKRVSGGGKGKRLPSAPRRDLFDVTPDDEQQMLQEAFGDFGQQKLRPAAQDADTAREAPAELIQQAAELGLTMLGVPEDLGGAVSERSAVTTVLAAESLARGDMGLSAAVLAPAGVATALSLWGDGDQQGTYLPEFVGESVPPAALAVLEPRALFDPFELQTTARPSDGGYVLDGLKSLVPLAASAELFVVAADIEGRGPGLFLIETGTKGVSVKEEPAMGLRAAATGQLALEGVSVPAGALLAEGDPDAYAECIRRSRIAWCALAVGTAQAVLDYVIPYVKERIAFGEPIANRQGVAFMVADIGIELDGMRLATYRAAGRADQGLDFARESALARRLCAQQGMKIGSDGVQLLGGHGYVKEHPVERWYRDLRAAGVMEGALLV